MSDQTLTICFDGTFNDIDLPDAQSNVLLLSRLLADQSSYTYLEGVGTRQKEELLGGIVGSGVRARVHEAYCWLQARFSRLDGVDVPQPKVFIFGFSRGAYAARLFAALIAFSGIPRFGNGISEEDGLNAFFDQKPKKAKKLKESKAYFDINVEFLGVWDTVNSTCEGDLGEQSLPDNVLHAYHAMSIDEKRNNFGLVRWDEGCRGEEIWFPGVHSDVGGGYKERELSDISLGWMLSKASAHGLLFTSDAEQYTETLPVGSTPTIHDSYTGTWIVLGSTPRTSRAGDFFHPSVQIAVAQASNYHPTFSVTTTENGQTYLV